MVTGIQTKSQSQMDWNTFAVFLYRNGSSRAHNMTEWFYQCIFHLYMVITAEGPRSQMHNKTSFPLPISPPCIVINAPGQTAKTFLQGFIKVIQAGSSQVFELHWNPSFLNTFLYVYFSFLKENYLNRVTCNYAFLLQ